jgi:hypothetical protein
MANNEGVDIIIKATDQYTKTINNITASNELFGKSIKNIEKEIATLENYMIKLVANGMNPASGAIKLLQNNLDQLKGTLTQTQNAAKGASGAVGGTENSIKNSGKAWTSLSLVVQDLPYGFRGIQNNLPALVGSFAAATGPIYFGFSALIAITTAYEKEIVQLIYGMDAAAMANKKMNEAVAQNIGQAKSQIAVDQSLLTIINDTTKSTDSRTRALNELKEKYKGNLELQSLDITDGTKLVGVYNKISDALLRKARAAAYATLIAEEEAKIFKLQNQEGADVVKSLGFVGTSLAILSAGTSGLAASTNVVNDAFANQAKEITQAGKNIAIYKKQLNETTQAQIDNADASSLDSTKPGGKTPEQLLAEKLKAIDNANDAETKALISSLDERGKKEYEAGLKLAENLKIMKAAGFKDSTTYYTAYRAEIDKIDAYYNNKEIEEARKTSEKIAKDAEIIDNRQLQNSLDALKIESDVAMKIANSTGNANATDRIKILEDYKNSLYELASVGGYTAEQFDKIDDALRRVDGAIEGSKDKVKNYTITWQETVNAINGILTNLDVSLITNFAEQIGNMMAGGKFDISQMGTILADALSSIGKALIAYAITNGAVVELFKNPKSWPLALAAGIAAVAAGTALKSKINNNKATAFANGGIVSGPTMGLVGEYPGAQSNPEVIAPLDKLKEMIGGGGGGMFVLRGQDLLLSVNRAQKASNLKGQNISLA